MKAECIDFMIKISYLPSTLSQLRNVEAPGNTFCYQILTLLSLFYEVNTINKVILHLPMV